MRLLESIFDDDTDFEKEAVVQEVINKYVASKWQKDVSWEWVSNILHITVPNRDPYVRIDQFDQFMRAIGVTEIAIHGSVELACDSLESVAISGDNENEIIIKTKSVDGCTFLNMRHLKLDPEWDNISVRKTMFDIDSFGLIHIKRFFNKGGNNFNRITEFRIETPPLWLTKHIRYGWRCLNGMPEVRYSNVFYSKLNTGSDEKFWSNGFSFQENINLDFDYVKDLQDQLYIRMKNLKRVVIMHRNQNKYWKLVFEKSPNVPDFEIDFRHLNNGWWMVKSNYKYVFT